MYKGCEFPKTDLCELISNVVLKGLDIVVCDLFKLFHFQILLMSEILQNIVYLRSIEIRINLKKLWYLLLEEILEICQLNLWFLNDP